MCVRHGCGIGVTGTFAHRCGCDTGACTCALLCAALWTSACQAPLSRGFSRQEYWSGLPCPPPGNLPNPGIESVSYDSYTGRWVLYH